MQPPLRTRLRMSRPTPAPTSTCFHHKIVALPTPSASNDVFTVTGLLNTTYWRPLPTKSTTYIFSGDTITGTTTGININAAAEIAATDTITALVNQTSSGVCDRGQRQRHRCRDRRRQHRCCRTRPASPRPAVLASLRTTELPETDRSILSTTARSAAARLGSRLRPREPDLSTSSSAPARP